MHDHDPHAEFRSVHDNALKSLRAIFLMTGRAPEDALRAAVSVVVALLDHGGPGWLERLIEAQASSQLRMMARIAARDLQMREMSDRARAQALLVCLARQALVDDVFGAVGAQAN